MSKKLRFATPISEITDHSESAVFDQYDEDHRSTIISEISPNRDLNVNNHDQMSEPEKRKIPTPIKHHHQRSSEWEEKRFSRPKSFIYFPNLSSRSKKVDENDERPKEHRNSVDSFKSLEFVAPPNRLPQLVKENLFRRSRSGLKFNADDSSSNGNMNSSRNLFFPHLVNNNNNRRVSREEIHDPDQHFVGDGLYFIQSFSFFTLDTKD